MNAKVKKLLLVTLIITIIFTAFAFFSFFFNIYYFTVEMDMTAVLSEIYCFFHLLICVFGVYFALKAFKSKSIMMRTLMYVNDYKELTPSKVAKGVAIGIICFGSILGVFYGLSFFINAPVWSWDFPLQFRLVLTNVGLFIASIAACFLIFPFIYDINKDIEERNKKISKYVKAENGGYVFVPGEEEKKNAFQKKMEKDEEYLEEEATMSAEDKEQMDDLNALYGISDKDDEEDK